MQPRSLFPGPRRHWGVTWWRLLWQRLWRMTVYGFSENLCDRGSLYLPNDRKSGLSQGKSPRRISKCAGEGFERRIRRIMASSNFLLRWPQKCYPCRRITVRPTLSLDSSNSWVLAVICFCSIKAICPARFLDVSRCFCIDGWTPISSHVIPVRDEQCRCSGTALRPR